MTPQESDDMRDWCREFGSSPRVLCWLKINPPPIGWQGTPAEYAYTEMPLAPGSFSL